MKKERIPNRENEPGQSYHLIAALQLITPLWPCMATCIRAPDILHPPPFHPKNSVLILIFDPRDINPNGKRRRRLFGPLLTRAPNSHKTKCKHRDINFSLLAGNEWADVRLTPVSSLSKGEKLWLGKLTLEACFLLHS